MSVEENKATFQQVGEVHNTGDLSAVPELIADDYIYHGPAGMELKGQEGFSQTVIALRNALPDLYATTEHVVAEGDMLAARLRLTGTHKGSLMGIAPTGKQLTFPEAVFIRFEDGKEVEATPYANMLSFNEQLGISPPEGQSGG